MQNFCVGWQGFPGCGEYTTVNAYLYLCAKCEERWYAEYIARHPGKLS